MAFPYELINGFYVSAGSRHESKIVPGKLIQNDPLIAGMNKFSIVVGKDSTITFYAGAYNMNTANTELITYKNITWNSTYTSELLDFYNPYYKISLHYTGNNFKVFIFKTSETEHEYLIETGIKMPTNNLRNRYMSSRTLYNGYKGQSSIELDSQFSNYSNFVIQISDGVLSIISRLNETKKYDISPVNFFEFETKNYLASEVFELTSDTFFQIINSRNDTFARFFNTGENSEYFIRIIPYVSSNSTFSWTSIILFILTFLLLIALIAVGVFFFVRYVNNIEMTE